MPCPSEDQLLGFASGTLDAETQKAVLEHLDTCAQCRSVVSMLGKTSLVEVRSMATPGAPGSVSGALPAVGQQVGRYFLLRVVGRGGMGVVFEAYDPELKREVALKVLVQRLEHHEVLDEARALATLTNPNVVTVYDSGRSGELVYIVMELINGQSLRHWMLEGHSAVEIIRIFTQVADGLTAVHAAKLVHRDIKPDNVVIGADGRARLIDFGFAFTDDAQTPKQIVGTPKYMAPEVVAGQPADALSDQFSFATALQEAFIGQRTPSHIARVVAKATQAVPSQRFASMEAVLSELQRDPSVRRRPALLVLAGLAVIALATVGAKFAIDRKSQLCTGGEQKLVGVWDADRRAAVEKAFASTGKTYSAQAFVGVTKLLDGYAAGWVEQYAQACQATRVTGEQSDAVLDLRMQCLTNRLERLRSTVQVLSEPDPMLADKAGNIAGDVPALSGCADVEGLQSEGPLAPSPEARAKVIKLGADLTRASALLEAERNADAMQIVDQTKAIAEKDGLKSITAEALLLTTRSKNRGGTADVEALSEKALLAAEATGQLKLLASAWVTRGQTLYQLGRHADAHAALAHANALLESLPREHITRGLRNYFSTAVYLTQHQPAEALVTAQQAVAEFEQDPSSARRVPEALRFEATALNFLTRREEALAAVRAAREKQIVVFGATHPSVERFFVTEGVILNGMGRSEESDAAYSQGMAICEAAQGEDALCVATGLNNLAISDLAQGRNAEAIKHLMRAAEIYTKRLGPDHPDLANTYAQLAEANVALGRNDEAITAAKQSLSIREKKFEPGSIPLAYGVLNLGETLLSAKHCAEAEAPLNKALALFHSNKAAAEDVGDATKDLAVAAFCEKKLPLGVTRARAALAIYQPLDNREISQAELRAQLADALWAQGAKAQAVTEAKAALAVYTAHKADKEVATLTLWLAKHAVK